MSTPRHSFISKALGIATLLTVLPLCGHAAMYGYPSQGTTSPYGTNTYGGISADSTPAAREAKTLTRKLTSLEKKIESKQEELDEFDTKASEIDKKITEQESDISNLESDLKDAKAARKAEDAAKKAWDAEHTITITDPATGVVTTKVEPPFEIDEDCPTAADIKKMEAELKKLNSELAKLKTDKSNYSESKRKALEKEIAKLEDASGDLDDMISDAESTAEQQAAMANQAAANPYGMQQPMTPPQTPEQQMASMLPQLLSAMNQNKTPTSTNTATNPVTTNTQPQLTAEQQALQDKLAKICAPKDPKAVAAEKKAAETAKASSDAPSAAAKTAIDANQAKTAEAEKKALEELCKKVQFNTDKPTGTGTPDGKINSLEEAQSLLGQKLCDPAKADCSSLATGGNQEECASLTKALSDLGRTPTWNKGEQVMGNTNLAVGTPIATFCNGDNYGVGTSGCSHTGIYLGQDATGVKILHQWNGSGGARIQTIPWNAWGSNTNEAGNKYYTIRSANSFLGIPWYLPSLTAGLNLVPPAAGLLQNS